MRRSASEYSAVYLSNYLGLVWPSALSCGVPMERTLYFKPCADLLANQVHEDPKSHRLWRQGGDVLEPRECRLPNMGVTRRFLQHLCSSVVLGPTMPLIVHAGEPKWWIKGCEYFLLFNHRLCKLCSTQSFLFYPKRPAARIYQVSGAGLGWDWEPLVCYSHVGGSGQMVVGAWDRHSKLSRQLPGWLSSPI